MEVLLVQIEMVKFLNLVVYFVVKLVVEIFLEIKNYLLKLMINVMN